MSGAAERDPASCPARRPQHIVLLDGCARAGTPRHALGPASAGPDPLDSRAEPRRAGCSIARSALTATPAPALVHRSRGDARHHGPAASSRPRGQRGRDGMLRPLYPLYAAGLTAVGFGSALQAVLAPRTSSLPSQLNVPTTAPSRNVARAPN